MKKFLEELTLITSLLMLIFGLGLFFGVAPQYTTGIGVAGLTQFLSITAGLILFFIYLVLVFSEPDKIEQKPMTPVSYVKNSF